MGWVNVKLKKTVAYRLLGFLMSQRLTVRNRAKLFRTVQTIFPNLILYRAYKEGEFWYLTRIKEMDTSAW